MACHLLTLPGQSISERAEEIKRKAAAIDAMVARGAIKVKVGPQGAIVFTGLSEQDRGRISDACIYRRLMATGSALARAKIAQAEQIAGRSVNKQVVGQGVHSHDGGNTWHSGH